MLTSARSAMSRGSGTLVLVVGASGVGKDTLIQLAKSQLTAERHVLFVEREITRPVGPHEYHVPLDDDEFQARLHRDYYLLHWRAHGVRYGIPGWTKAALAAGQTVVSITSRTMVTTAQALPWRCECVEVRAPAEVVRRRLEARSERVGAANSARLARASMFPLDAPGVHTIENGGRLADSGRAFVALLRQIAAQTHEARAAAAITPPAG